MARKSMIKGMLSARLMTTVIAAAALGTISVSAAKADYLSHRSTDLFFAQDDFSTWVPRKGKMSYENDASQPEFGTGGRADTYTVNCKTLQSMVGPGGKAKDGDTILVSDKGACNISGLRIHKAVKIMPASMPQIRRPLLFGELDKALAQLSNHFPVKMQCSTIAGPCITVNVDPDKYAAIIGFHITANSRLLAPLIESRSGGMVLKHNYIEGQSRPFDGPQTTGYEQATAILIHGSKAIIEQNTIAHARSGITLVPTQKSPKGGQYHILANTIARIGLNAITADGSIFMAQRPGIKIVVGGNQIDAGSIGIMSSYTEMDVAQNTFGPSEIHAIFLNGIARVSENVFRGAQFDSIQLVESPRAYISDNLFEDNKTTISGLEYSLANRSPYPAGNICRDQPFGSFYNGAPHMISYVDVNSGGVTSDSSFTKKRVSRSKIRKSRRKEPALWAAFDAFLSGLDEESSEATGKISKVEMWGAFKSFFYKIQEDVVAHILFDRPDVNPEDGYYACLDYSLIYKFGVGPGGGEDGIFSK